MEKRFQSYRGTWAWLIQRVPIKIYSSWAARGKMPKCRTCRKHWARRGKSISIRTKKKDGSHLTVEKRFQSYRRTPLIHQVWPLKQFLNSLTRNNRSVRKSWLLACSDGLAEDHRAINAFTDSAADMRRSYEKKFQLRNPKKSSAQIC